MTIKNTTALLFATAVALTGCTTAKPMFYKDGELATVVNCSNSSWVDCYEVAGKQCESSGYQILEKIVSRDVGFWGSEEKKQMLFICKPKQ